MLGSPDFIMAEKNEYLNFISEKIKRLKTAEVRDLAWVIAAPPLFNTLPNSAVKFFTSDFFEQEFKRILPALTELDKNPEPLRQFLENENTHLLGKYFEALIKFWLLEFSEFEIIQSNVQIFDGDKTIGEIDFLIKNKERKVFHLETAGKYYLSLKGDEKWKNFYGPNPADNLKQKIEKLLGKQVKLSSTRFAEKLLNSNGIETSPTPLIIFKGYFFYHWNKERKFVPPIGANKNHLHGWWVKFDEIENILFNKAERWLVLERRNWISRQFLVSKEKTQNSYELKAQLKNYFSSNTYPLLFAKLTEEGKSYSEKERFFVIPELESDLSHVG